MLGEQFQLPGKGAGWCTRRLARNPKRLGCRELLRPFASRTMAPDDAFSRNLRNSVPFEPPQDTYLETLETRARVFEALPEPP